MISKKKIVYFRKLSFENWAQYQNNEFEFPDINLEDRSSKIIYFLAENGVGKTRFFQAFRAVLFGDKDSSLAKFSKRNLYELFPTSKREEIKLKLEKNEEIEAQNMVLTLEFVVVDTSSRGLEKFYKVERMWTYKNFSKGRNNTIKFKAEQNVKIMEKATGGIYTKIEISRFEDILDEFWPEAARDFYFFDGEKLQKMMEDPEKKDIKEKALKNSDFFPLDDSIIPFMDAIVEDFDKQKTSKSRKKDLVDEADLKIKKLSKQIKNKKEELDEVTSQIRKSSELLNDLQRNYDENLGDKIQDLKKYEKAQPIIKQLKKHKNTRDRIYKEVGNLMGDNKKKIYYFELLLIYDIIKEVMNDLKEKKRNNIIPTKLDKATIEYIKSLEYCLCGNKLGENELNNLERHKEKAIDEDLNEMATDFLNILIRLDEALIDIKKELDLKYLEFVDVSRKIEEIKVPFHNPGIDSELLEKYQETEEKINNLRNLKIILNENQKQLKKEIDVLESGPKGKTHWENLQLKRLRKEKEIEKSDLYHLLARESLVKLREVKESLQSKIINTIKSTTNETFLQLIPESSKYLGVYIDTDWKFGFIHKKNPNTPVYDPSKGQFHVIGLSFLKSISKVAKHNVPILFDTPFGRLSSRPKINIGRSIPKLFKGAQVMIFLTEEEARNMIDYISDKQGYELFNKSGFEITYEPIRDNNDLNTRLERIKEASILISEEAE